MESTIFAIAALGKGSLSIMPKPDTADLHRTFEAIKSHGASQLVSLLESSEADLLGLADEAAWCEQFQLEFLHYPITDFSTPTSVIDFAVFTRNLHLRIQDGAQVVIHCRGGIGRAGMTASSVLIHSGYGADVAIGTVSKARGKAVPETDDQKAFITDIERWADQSNKKKGR